MRHPRSSDFLSSFAIAMSAALLPGISLAQAPQHPSQRDQVTCATGNSSQSQADCLYEARSVRRDAAAGKTAPAVSSQVLAANALARCQVQPVKERAACEHMVQGMGTREGSVSQGGVVTEITTTTVTPAPAATPL